MELDRPDPVKETYRMGVIRERLAVLGGPGRDSPADVSEEWKLRGELDRLLGMPPEEAAEEDVEIDISEISGFKFGDQFLLCSDGLYDVVTEEEVESRLRVQSDSLEVLLDYFIELARSRGAPDNVTVVLVRVEEDDRA